MPFCDGLFLPLLDGEQQWNGGLRAGLYMIGLLWCFMGVAIISDIFMGAIEAITSKRKRILIPKTEKYVTVMVWNATVANLTLMALGSSAPEILLSVIELLADECFSGELGPSTIVGSAAFNLLIITAVCVEAIPDGEIRKINDTSVFAITATFSILAYIWLLVILSFTSEDLVDPWEAIVTFLLFPVLVSLAFAADKGFFSNRKGINKPQQSVLMVDYSKEELAALMAQVRREAPGDKILSDEKVLHLIEKQTQAQRSRAAYRVGATRSLTGSRRVGSSSGSMLHCSVEEKDDGFGNSNHEHAVIDFVAGEYALLESAGTLVAHVHRTGNLETLAKVCFRTRDGSAKAWEDYIPCDGEVVFAPYEVRKEVVVKIIDDAAYEEDEVFYIDLHQPSPGVVLGEVATTEVTIIDDDEPGILSFEKDVLHVLQDSIDKVVPVEVQRKHGSTGLVSCKYKTEDGSAVSPADYEGASGELQFHEGQCSAFIEIKIKACGRYERQEVFRIILEEPNGGAKFDGDTDGGHESNICTVYIEADSHVKDSVDRLNRLLRVNWDRAQLGATNWTDQFKSALYCNGSPEEQAEAGKMDWILHIAGLPWKLIFALVPPTDFAGGWLCFSVALMFIGGVTAIIGDLAGMMGCCIGIPDAVTAITFVALGTSLPDTFASKSAAQEDPYADASVGNVTGSNSVNVFLGLGLPWTIGAFYWTLQGPTADWKTRYPDMPARYPSGGFIVRAGSLAFSVLVFSACALCCIGILCFRRRCIGGELGGSKAWKHLSAAIMVFLWFLYISVASWKFVCEKQGSGDDPETTNMVMLASLGVLFAMPVMVFGFARILGLLEFELVNDAPKDNVTTASAIGTAPSVPPTTSTFHAMNIADAGPKVSESLYCEVVKPLVPGTVDAVKLDRCDCGFTGTPEEVQNHRASCKVVRRLSSLMVLDEAQEDSDNLGVSPVPKSCRLPWQHSCSASSSSGLDNVEVESEGVACRRDRL